MTNAGNMLLPEMGVDVTVREQSPPLRPPKALIVTEHLGEDAILRRDLEEEGWTVEVCAGPRSVSCPVMRGERCPLRRSADAAIVFVDQKLNGRLGAMPKLRCAADSCSPGVVALEGNFTGPIFGPGIAAVGALRGPEAILSAVAALMAQE